MKLRDIARALGVLAPEERRIAAVCIDSRTSTPGCLFIALRGDRFDGHRFIQDAVSNGAIAVICEVVDPAVDVPQLLVKNTQAALATIATFHRSTITCPVIALTGSNGKTTVKEMIASILPKPAFATHGNLNNHIGVPLSVLQVTPEDRCATFELGANHPGEIAHTVAIAQPHVALVNTIAPAHIEGFGSLDGVARAKGEIYQGLAAGGTAVINDDDAYAHFWDPLLTDKRIVRFSIEKPADIYARDVHYNPEGQGQFTLITPDGEAPIQLRIAGKHNVSNALAAAACCYSAGIRLADIAHGLNQFRGVAGRLTFLPGKHQTRVIDDTYNANLRSVLAALHVLAAQDGRRIFVFGDMGELGQWAREHHEEVGIAARDLGIEMLMAYGTHSAYTALAYGAAGKHYTTQDDLAHDLLCTIETPSSVPTTILVKGSRAAGMENIVHQLLV